MQLKKTYHLSTFFILFAFFSCQCQNSEILRRKINHIISDKKAIVGVSIIAPNGKDTLSINGNKHFPLQSVFKFHIALATLAQVDRGKLQLHQQVKVNSNQLLPKLWSPLREAYPKGGVFTIAQLIEYAVAQSDNVACDALIRLLGTPKNIENYLKRNGFTDFAIQYNEQNMQSKWENMFQNWMTPKISSEILEKY